MSEILDRTLAAALIVLLLALLVGLFLRFVVRVRFYRRSHYCCDAYQPSAKAPCKGRWVMQTIVDGGIDGSDRAVRHVTIQEKCLACGHVEEHHQRRDSAQWVVL